MSLAKRGAPASVVAFLESLDHPFKPEILVLRRQILEADPSIAEGIKWNAPSFRTTEYFATMHLRAQEGVQIILHLGAKRRAPAAARTAVADPESLLTWLGEDRASVLFHDQAEIEARRSAFTAILRDWIQLL